MRGRCENSVFFRKQNGSTIFMYCRQQFSCKSVQVLCPTNFLGCRRKRQLSFWNHSTFVPLWQLRHADYNWNVTNKEITWKSFHYLFHHFSFEKYVRVLAETHWGWCYLWHTWLITHRSSGIQTWLCETRFLLVGCSIKKSRNKTMSVEMQDHACCKPF